MAFQELVQYVCEPPGGGESAVGRFGGKICKQETSQRLKDGLAGEMRGEGSRATGRRPGPGPVLAMSASSSRKTALVRSSPLLRCHRPPSGSAESLGASVASCSDATSSSCSSSDGCSPPSPAAAATVMLTRSGSIRVNAESLQRGASSHGSPAFRRKKMRSRSELHLTALRESTPRQRSPFRRSGLPVPAPAATAAAGALHPDEAMAAKKQQSPAAAGPAASLRDKRRMTGATSTATASPRNSLAKDVLTRSAGPSSASATASKGVTASVDSADGVLATANGNAASSRETKAASTMQGGVQKERAPAAAEGEDRPHSVSVACKGVLVPPADRLEAAASPPSAPAFSLRPTPPSKPSAVPAPAASSRIPSSVPTTPSPAKAPSPKWSDAVSRSCTATPRSAVPAMKKSAANLDHGRKNSPRINRKRPTANLQKRLGTSAVSAASSHLNRSSPSLAQKSSSGKGEPASQSGRTSLADAAAPSRAVAASGSQRNLSRQRGKERDSLIDTLLGDAASLSMAPKAKFRSDGEISVCETKTDGHIYETIDDAAQGRIVQSVGGRRPVRPPRATVAKNVVSPLAPPPSCSSSSSLSAPPPHSNARGKPAVTGRERGATVGAEGRGPGRGGRRQQQAERLSAEVQCWPWMPKCVNPSPRVASALLSRSLPNAEIVPSHARPAREGRTTTTRATSAALQQRSQRNRHAQRGGRGAWGEGRQIGLGGQQRQSKQDTPKNAKSASLGSDGDKFGFFKTRSGSFTFLQRQLGGLRRSFSFRSSSGQRISPSVKLIPRQEEGRESTRKRTHCDEDWVFFRGFGGKRREDLDRIEPYAVTHGPLLTIKSCSPQPQAPPRRKRPRRDAAAKAPLRRTLSLTDAHFIAQAVYEGDAGLIEELYPDFPRSTPIYASIDPAKKEQDRNRRRQVETNRQSHPPGKRTSSGAQSLSSTPSSSRLEDHRLDDSCRKKGRGANKETPPGGFGKLLTPIPGSRNSSQLSEEECGGITTAVPRDPQCLSRTNSSPATQPSSPPSPAAVATRRSSSGSSNRWEISSLSSASNGRPPLTSDSGDNFARVSRTAETTVASKGCVDEGVGVDPRRALLRGAGEKERDCSGTSPQILLPSSHASASARLLPVEPSTRRREDLGLPMRNDFESRPRHQSRQHHRLLPGAPSLQDNSVTFSSPVMFVKQASDLHSRVADLPDSHLINHPSRTTCEPYGIPDCGSSRRVTKVSLDSSSRVSPPMPPASATVAGMKEPSPVISPWNTHGCRPGSTSSNESSSAGSTTEQNNDNLWTSRDVHPFTQRTQQHYLQRQQYRSVGPHHKQNRGLVRGDGNYSCNQDLSSPTSDVVITSSRGGGVTISPAILSNAKSDVGNGCAFSLPAAAGVRMAGCGRQNRSESVDRLIMDNDLQLRAISANVAPVKKFSAPAMGKYGGYHSKSEITLGSEEVSNGTLDESFRKIIARADSSINQAESILSSLRAEKSEISLSSPSETADTPNKPHSAASTAQRTKAYGAALESSEESSEPASLCSDIETNIRRLEKTQAKINAALETFRSVQAMNSNDGVKADSSHDSFHLSYHRRRYPGVELRSKQRLLFDSSLKHLPQQQRRGLVGNENASVNGHEKYLSDHSTFFSLPPPRPDSETHACIPPSPLGSNQFGQLETNTANFENNSTLPALPVTETASLGNCKSRTAPGNLEGELERQMSLSGTPVSSSSLAITQDGSQKPVRKTSLFRRHSFNVGKDKAAASGSPANLEETTELSARDSLGWYEGDVESEGQRSNATLDDPYSYSDSEGGAVHQVPLRSRIKGLFGSFGKGKKKVHRSNSKRRRDQQHPSLNQQISVNSTCSDITHDAGPALKASLGEFTKQIESLSAKNDHDSEMLVAQSPVEETYYTAHVTSVSCTTKSTDASFDRSGAGVVMRQKNGVAKSDSMNTCPSLNQSNRNSVLSGQSMSSESYEEHSVSDDERAERHHSSSNTSPRSRQEEASVASGPGGIDDGNLTPKQRKEKKVYYIAREIMTSEKVFVDILRLINVEFREFVQRARKESKSGIMADADFARLFSNLPELQTLNEDLLQDFEDRIENWDSHKKIADVIVRKGPFLKLYTTYIREFSSVNQHFDECCQRYPKFGKLVKEFEKGERCRSLKLKHFMLKPVQRLPQYKLLLEDYLKHLQSDSPDFDDTTNALHVVSEAADHANDTIKQNDQFRKMLKLQSRLGDAELIRPGRELVKEGELQKISRKGEGPRYFVLLSDCLLYCTYSGWPHDSGDPSSAGLRITYKIPLTALQVRAPPSAEGHYALEFNVTSPVRSCTLRASTPQERNDWLDALNSAIEEHVSRKATFNVSSGSAASAANGAILSPEEAAKVGNSAPVWVPDSRVTMCQNCAVEFSVLIRRHHCRACGKVVCAPCSSNKAPLRYRDFEAARVCDACFQFLEKELEPMDNLKTRFKKRDTSRNGRYVPPRLKVSANGGDGAQMCGYLRRRINKAGNAGSGTAVAGGKNKWKRMWFVLKDRVLYAYKASEDTVACETFPILGYQLDTLSEKNFEVYEGENAGLVFVLTHPGDGAEALVFCADNDNVCEKWMAAIREAVNLDAQDDHDNANAAIDIGAKNDL